MAQWVGIMVSIKCLNGMGSYQGEIAEANADKLTLKKAFREGFPCDGPVEISAADIDSLKFIEKPAEQPQENSIITIPKPVPKRAPRFQSYSECSNVKPYSAVKNPSSSNKSKPVDGDLSKRFDESLSFSQKNSTPKRGPKGGKQWVKGWKDEECFGSSVDKQIKGDFDFEKNLALFDKQAIWEELNSQKPDVIRTAENRKKYRHDENVIASQPLSARQIVVPKQEISEYVTDSGLVVPCISRALRKKLFDAAEKAGLDWNRQVEVLGTVTAELSIQLIGGGHRLNPTNMHQLPTVVLLCGPHKQGAVGINTARQLASHGVRTVVFCVSLDAPAIKKELALYVLTKNRTVTMVSELPAIVDLIICALCDDSETPKSHANLAEWTNKNKAPVLALDPPACGTPGISPKISLLPVLPLRQSSKNGQLYLANLGYPSDVFNMVGIKYVSPFGPKNIIPLHPNE